MFSSLFILRGGGGTFGAGFDKAFIEFALIRNSDPLIIRCFLKVILVIYSIKFYL